MKDNRIDELFAEKLNAEVPYTTRELERMVSVSRNESLKMLHKTNRFRGK